MSRVCDVSGARRTVGGSIVRKGMAKKKGGIGTHVVKNNKRVFLPNLQKRRIYVPELDRWVTLKITNKMLRSIQKNGAYKMLKEAKDKGTLTVKVPGL
ncbi:MAG TPA: 50S ribosomal protein L28 [Lentisphaeria bacterium]|nr:50S ribosomal protein L28 [Lentisphaeria bacterium]|tara:strand:+ start:2302 stop:2595 length:294 start_codon:yes stop_codon:yes gene_type:complete